MPPRLVVPIFAAFAIILSSFPASLAAPADIVPTWVATPDLGAFDLAQGVALDGDGNIYVVGTTETEMGQDIVVMRLDASGGVVWTRVIDHGDKDRVEDVISDGKDAIYVVGAVEGHAGDDALLVKYKTSGDLLWTKTFDKGTSEAGRAVAIDRDGYVFMTGVSLSANGADGFLAKFQPDGGELWSKPVNIFYVDELFDVAVDGQAPILVGRVLAERAFNGLVRKYDKDAQLLWSSFLNGEHRVEARGVAVDAAGTIYVVGTKGVGTDGAALDLLVAAYAKDGKPLWERAIDVDGGADDEGRDIAVDPSGNLVLTGFSTRGTEKDAFVIKLKPGATGAVLWKHAPKGTGVAGAGSVVLSRDGATIVVAGATQREGTDFDFYVASYDQGKPLAGFQLPGAAPRHGTPVKFEDTSSASRGQIVSWEWDFGDGGSSTEASPTHTFASGGAFTVRLVVKDQFDNKAESTRTVIVEGPGDTNRPSEGTFTPLPPPKANTGTGTSGAAPESKVKVTLGFWVAGGLLLGIVTAGLIAGRVLRKRE